MDKLSKIINEAFKKVTSEYEYLDRKYGKYRLISQELTVDGFDVLTIELPDGRRIQERFKVGWNYVLKEKKTVQIPFNIGDEVEVFDELNKRLRKRKP